MTSPTLRDDQTLDDTSTPVTTFLVPIALTIAPHASLVTVAGAAPADDAADEDVDDEELEDEDDEDDDEEDDEDEEDDDDEDEDAEDTESAQPGGV